MATAAPSIPNDALKHCFAALKSKRPETRLNAASELQRYVSTALVDMPPEAAARLWEDTIYPELVKLVNSQSDSEKLGGLLAIEHLIVTEQERTVESRRNRLYRLYNYVKTLLPNPDINIMLAASKTLGKIAEVGSDALADYFMDYEVQSAIQLLSADKQDPGRYAGVLILKELAKSSPMYFHPHLSLVFDNILMPLRDHRNIVRESASELLAACLEIFMQRERQTESNYLVKTWQDAQAGLKTASPDIIHGSLLTYRELLLHGGMFMRSYFADVAEQIMKFRTHKDLHVRKMVITLIPTLAVYDTQTFSELHLHPAMAYLMAQLDSQNDKAIAYIAIGHIASAVGPGMRPFLEGIMNHINADLKMRGKKYIPPEEAIFQCVGMLAAAVGPHLTKLLHTQLDLMFDCGLSVALVQALDSISRNIPPLLRTIQDRLLASLSNILSDRRYVPLGAPSSLLPGDNTTSKESFVPEGAAIVKTPDLLILALDTLGTFDFAGHVLSDFVRDDALPFDNEDARVRQAAAVTCCRLLSRDPICYQTSTHSIEIMSGVMNKLLTMGIADPEPSVRQTVLSSLHERFDKHLAQAENVKALFIALNDEVFEIRLTAIGLIGRIALHNPAYVMPSLRKALLQLLNELEYSNAMRGREECTRLLSHLINATQRLIKPYAIPMLRALLLKVDDPNPTIAANIMVCLGELACAGGEEALTFVPDLMTAVMTMLSQPVSVKRDAALRTLGQVCSSTGYVIDPLIEHPQLLQSLSKLLSSGPSQPIRREVIRVLGILGAVDPYRRKTKPEEEAANEVTVNVKIVPRNVSSSAASPDDYYQTVAVNALLSILRDHTLSSEHHKVIEAIMSIFKTQGLKCVAFLPQIIPAFAEAIRISSGKIQIFHLEQFAILVGIIKQHIRRHMPVVFELIIELWDNTPLQFPLAALVEALGKALDAEFKPFLPTLLPLLLKAFDGDTAERAAITQMKIFDSFLTFGVTLEEYLQLIIPIIVRSAERPDAPVALRKKAMQTIEGLLRRINLADYASRIIHPLVRVVKMPNNELKTAAMDTLCAILLQIGSDFAIFDPVVHKAYKDTGIHHFRYEELSRKLANGEELPQDAALHEFELARAPEYSAPAEATRMTVNQHHLKQAWDTKQIATREDWNEWMHRLTVEFMRESPSHALRACMSLVDIHTPLAKELFNAAFLSCWVELYQGYQEELVQAIEAAINSPYAPSELAHRLLELAEFMEHEEKALPIGNNTLGQYAMSFHAYAKALHYKELEFFTETSPNIIESLIDINSKLQQHDAAWGTLLVAREQYDVSKHEEWYERLGRWQEALTSYDQKAIDDPDTPGLMTGRMKCLHALGEWDRLAHDVEEFWSSASLDDRREIAPLATAAAWSLRQWNAMDDYIAMMKPDSADRPFYRAVLLVHQNQFPKAMSQIAKARDLLDPDLASLVGENYGRSYNTMVRAQMLSELEEIIAYKQCADQPERRLTMRKTWTKRLRGCQPDVEVWQRILQVRALVLNPGDDSVTWIKFANLCRKSDRMFLVEKTIHSLMPDRTRQRLHGEEDRVPGHVVYAHLKYLWAIGSHEECLRYLNSFTETMTKDLQQQSSGQAAPMSKTNLDRHSRLLARCHYKQGQWKAAFHEDWGSRPVEEILQSYCLATFYDPSWYKAWHTWALANFDVVSYYESQTDRRGELPGRELATHIVQAIDGFFRSIALRNVNAIQDTLRLLTLWFKYGAHDEVSNAMAAGFSSVEIDTWLEVIPQIIARIQTPNRNIRRNINSLLTEIGRHHPQALIYPLTVASKSSSTQRSSAALKIMDRLREHSARIVDQALLVSHELIRVAILWHERWHDGLEEASRLYFNDHNPDGMIAHLEPLHKLLDDGPQTQRESSFAQVFGRDLHDAREACRRYRIYGEIRDLEKAWEIYYAVFQRIEKQLQSMTALDLQYVSPELLKCRNLELAVPGTYQSGKPVVRIASFVAKLTVIQSKQHPRRLVMKGSDGKTYQFLLKGHEDLRQDERVMQLFSLVNNLLSLDVDSFKRRLHIRRFSVTPLAPEAGLIGWVEDSDTLHVLIKEYRDSRKVLLDIERRLMLQMAPDYENLVLLQKIEVFEYALENTTGQDLYRVLWLKSANSEHWLERRATYTRSLAVNSMVGHILGLGDRHPSNLMLEQNTGQVVHIDFGDCFEVAMHREKYPEKVPFRLTRMLTHAMEVSGIEGSFRNSCEISMKVLRDNKESLMAVLEAFVYDPLITWRLIRGDGDDRRAELMNPDRNADLVDASVHSGRAAENDIFNEAQEVRNERALAVYNRVQHKLNGRDFNPEETLSVPAQVDKLIIQATSLENLCQSFSGWCAFW